MYSHAQADASGTAAAMYFAYERLGLHNWIDMRQKVLTLEGMRQGVRESDVFLLLLTEHVLASWFCQQEMLCAIQEGKKVQLLLEEESRFHPFDVEAWYASKNPPADVDLKQQIEDICVQIKGHREKATEAIATDDDAAEAEAYDAIKSLHLRKKKVEAVIKSASRRMIRSAWGELVEIPPKICEMIDTNLP
eukprot:COSAG02_NODE_7216_length_3113_cov_16.308842_1_plen_191_part_10